MDNKMESGFIQASYAAMQWPQKNTNKILKSIQQLILQGIPTLNPKPNIGTYSSFCNTLPKGKLK